MSWAYCRRRALAAACVAAFCIGPSIALAEPWATVGDAQLRSDIEILAAAGVVDGITMTWPLPWTRILSRLQRPDALDDQPDYVRDAAARVRKRGLAEASPYQHRLTASLDAASGASVIRGFDALGRQSLEGQLAYDELWSTTAIHIAIGLRTSSHGDRSMAVLDNTYIAQEVGHAVVYAGFVTHWWGPGWISALSLSNNARPMPQIGIARMDTAPSDSPWLSWLGPWQAEFFVGLLNGPRINRNTIYSGFRLGINPLPGLEIGLARTTEICGSGHPCSPLDYFQISNDPKQVNATNDQGNIDLRYSHSFGHWSYAVYAQFMNEDTNPVIHSGTSHLVGATLWSPLSDDMARMTVEYTDSVATRDIWGAGTLHGVAYNNTGYPDGMRYRGQSLGFSLDSDSRLLSVQASISDAGARSIVLTYHHADISTDRNTEPNVVTTAPVALNMVQARLGLPFYLRGQSARLDLEVRYQDDQPRPDKGALAQIEVALRLPI